MNIYECLNYISKMAFPKIKYTWDELSIDKTGKFFRISICTNKVEDYITSHYETGLKSLIKSIESNDLPSKVEFYSKQLLVVLANQTINCHSDICKNKAEIACKLYKKYPLFRETVIEYASNLYDLIPNLIAYSFFHLDFNMVKDVFVNCISKYKVRTETYDKLLDNLHGEFTYNHSFEKLLKFENVLKYWEISEYINETMPELNFYQIHDGKTMIAYKKDYDLINEAKPYIKLVKKRNYWIKKEELPDMLEFSFRYPNGVNGDLIRYIFEEYGEIEKKNATIWHGKVSKKHLELFEMFSTITNYITYDPDFYKIFDNHHLPTILYRNRYSVANTRNLGSIFYEELMEVLNEHKDEQKKMRVNLYSQLILMGKTSPKWKSEAKLFSIVSNKYSDAIYQYRADWLGMQSLDIYIPSLSVAIEYQGIQHYTPIEYFGGESHFKLQKANDQKKKKLCKKNGVTVIEWSYMDVITEENLEKHLNEVFSDSIKFKGE